MGCCNARTLSYFSASIQLTVWIICLILVSVAGVVLSGIEPDEYVATNFKVAVAKLAVILLAILCVIAIIMLIILFVGIKKKRRNLVSIYVYMSYGFFVVGIIFLLYDLIMNIINNVKATQICFNVFINLLILGIEILLFTPIFIFHRKLDRPPVLPTTNNARPQQGANTHPGAYSRYQ